MSNQAGMLEAEAMKLAPEERARLAERLLASLSDDAELEAAWGSKSSDASPTLKLGVRRWPRPPKRLHARVMR